MWKVLPKAAERISARMSYGNLKKGLVAVSNEVGVMGRRGVGRNGSWSF